MSTRVKHKNVHDSVNLTDILLTFGIAAKRYLQHILQVLIFAQALFLKEKELVCIKSIN